MPRHPAPRPRGTHRVNFAVLMLVLVGACGPAPLPQAAPDGANAAPRRGGALSMSLAADVTSWDPIVATDNPSIWSMLLIYDQLVRVAPDGRSVEPALAEQYAISDDGKTYTFTMRRDVLFHDGTPLHIEDLQYAIERGISQESTWKSLFPPIAGFATPDDRTLVVELTEPWAPFLADLALYAFSVIPKQQHQQQGAAFFDQPIGSGPFVFDRWQRGSNIRLQRNPAFWDRRYPYLDSVEFDVRSDENSRMLAFRGGELDIATDVPANQVAGLQNDPNVVMQLAPLMRINLISINHARPPFDDVRVRLAVNRAIDRAAIVNSVLFGHGIVANTALPPMPYWSENVPAYAYDIAQARQLLASSSRPAGFETTLTLSAGDGLQRAVATIVQDQLKQIGVELTIVEVDRAAFFETAVSGDYDLALAGISSDIIDPDQLAGVVLAPSGGVNALFTNYKNPQLDALVRQAASTLDDGERAELYQQLQQIYSDDGVIVPLYYPYSRTALRSYVKGFKVLPTGNYRLWEAWLDR